MDICHTFVMWVHVFVKCKVEVSSLTIIVVLDSRFLIFLHFEFLIKTLLNFGSILLVYRLGKVNILDIRAVLTQLLNLAIVAVL